MSKLLLRNDTALVTGAAQGIGQAIARAIEEEGAKVFAVDREFDLSQPGSARSLVETAIEKLKTVSIFVHAASPPRKEEQNALAVTEAQWREMLEINLNAGFLIAQALGPSGIGVNAIVPGAVPGAGFKGSPDLVEKIALRRVGKPGDIAPMAVAILSEKYGAYMTGASVVVDGGLALYNWLEAQE